MSMRCHVQNCKTNGKGTGKYVLGERYFAKFEVKESFGGIFYIAVTSSLVLCRSMHENELPVFCFFSWIRLFVLMKISYATRLHGDALLLATYYSLWANQVVIYYSTFAIISLQQQRYVDFTCKANMYQLLYPMSSSVDVAIYFSLVIVLLSDFLAQAR